MWWCYAVLQGHEKLIVVQIWTKVHRLCIMP